MQCPFCHVKLTIWEDLVITNYRCANEECESYGIPRYQITYNNYPTKLINKIFIVDDFYIQLDYARQNTFIHKIVACFLYDSIEIPYLLYVDFKNLTHLKNKIKILMIFS